MTTLIHFVHALSAAWAAAGELITAGAILWTLNAAANLIRLTFKAGCLAGRMLWPVIHATVAGLRWAARNIDWRMVAMIVIESLVIIAASVWTATVWSHRMLIVLSERAGHCFAALITAADATLDTIQPMVHPLAEVASELDSMTCSQLRAMLGNGRKVRKLRKAQLIEALLV